MTVVCREIALHSPEHRASLELRARVLREPLGLTWSDVDRDDEPKCIHLAVFADETIAGTLLLKPLDAEVVKMRQVAIAPDTQGTGIGAQLVRFAEEVARKRGFRKMIAHARDTAVGFYEKLGYATEGEPFEENTITHQLVTKPLV